MNKDIILTDWNLTDYNDGWKKQEDLLGQTLDKKAKDEPTDNILVFCEHPHVYTLGKSGDDTNLLINSLQLRNIEATFVHTNRGGDITYHGPGQLVGYPIFDLENFHIGLKQYVFLIEESIIRLLETYGVPSGRLAGATGVWLDPDNENCRKICAIGIRSSHFVTMHGFALNVNTDLKYFSYIHPCGFVDKGVTSLSQELNKPVDMVDLKTRLYKIIQKVFLQ